MKSSSVTSHISIGLALLALMITGCGPSPSRRAVVSPTIERNPALIATTPQEAARQAISLLPEPGVADSFRIRGTRYWRGGVVVLYDAFRAADEHAPAMPLQGYIIVERAPGGWTPAIGGGGRSSNSTEDLVDFGTGGGTTAKGAYNILYGQVLSSDVLVVEATFDDGQTRRDEADDQIFAFVTPERVIVCELRVLGANEQMLRNIDLTLFPDTPPNNCAIWKSGE